MRAGADSTSIKQTLSTFGPAPARSFRALQPLARQPRPYVRSLRDEAAAIGLPIQRPLFLLDPDPALFSVHDCFADGPDMIVAPVLEEGATRRSLPLPAGEWCHLWCGERFSARSADVAAPIGQPPVYTRVGSPFADLFESLAA